MLYSTRRLGFGSARSRKLGPSPDCPKTSMSTTGPIFEVALLSGLARGLTHWMDRNVDDRPIAALHAKRQTYPLVDLRALRVRSYAVTIWGGSLFRIATASIPFLLPLL